MSSPKKNAQKTSKWVARVGDIGFFQGFARTRARLVIASIASTSLSLAAIVAVSHWIRDVSGYPNLNMLIIACMVALLIIASYIDSMLIGDIIFPGRWRERVLLGRELEPRDLVEEQAFAHEYNVHFLFIVAGCVLALIFVSQRLTGGFLDYYQRLGFALSLMRSDDPDDRLNGLTSISGAYYEDSWGDPALHGEIAHLVDDDVPEVRDVAIYAAGRLGVIDAGAALLRNLLEDRTEEGLRARSARSLGRMRYPDALIDLGMLLRDPSTPGPVRLGILQGLSFWKAPQIGPNIASFLDQCTDAQGQRALAPEEVRLAFHVLRQNNFDGGRALAFDLIHGRLCPSPSLEEQCSALEFLRFSAKLEDVEALRALADVFPPTMRCETYSWKLREESPHVIVDPEHALSKVIRAVGNRRDYRMFEWIKAINTDPHYPGGVRNIAAIYVKNLQAFYANDCATPEQRQHPRCKTR